MAIHTPGRSYFGFPANAGNLLSPEAAHALLNNWVPNERLRLHMKQVGETPQRSLPRDYRTH